jgi:hypothetical protein
MLLRVAALVAVVLLSCGTATAQSSTCTVPAQFSTINAGLAGCGGGVGYITLVISPGTYTETLSFGLLLASATLQASNYDSVPANPGLSNVTVIVAGVGHVIDNDTMALVFNGSF